MPESIVLNVTCVAFLAAAKIFVFYFTKEPLAPFGHFGTSELNEFVAYVFEPKILNFRYYRYKSFISQSRNAKRSV